jgi:hypothetical protein
MLRVAAARILNFRESDQAGAARPPDIDGDWLLE